jgi:hypothetical protein
MENYDGTNYDTPYNIDKQKFGEGSGLLYWR